MPTAFDNQNENNENKSKAKRGENHDDPLERRSAGFERSVHRSAPSAAPPSGIKLARGNTVALIDPVFTGAGHPNAGRPHGGVLGWIEGDRSGRTVMLRADIDALPIQEDAANGGGLPKPCVSEIPRRASMPAVMTVIRRSLLSAAKALPGAPGRTGGHGVAVFLNAARKPR